LIGQRKNQPIGKEMNGGEKDSLVRILSTPEEWNGISLK
jgi:hypothetical protein